MKIGYILQIPSDINYYVTIISVISVCDCVQNCLIIIIMQVTLKK